ncbi:O-antigen ligase family protein [Sedimentisphaera salicampi]|uniref:Lipid A core-O-antigen ligase n=1 Tax=Sedimentisphaera salicampi TaxID=1941349 RepID=A0A1W6LKL7_9BACT|nr:O-antigen ligase family protein [Sedimentisphaera salicampi]ARN56292.1 Lipid A core - O-antigen ligase [Sedimentisphaera salicampi]
MQTLNTVNSFSNRNKAALLAPAKLTFAEQTSWFYCLLMGLYLFTIPSLSQAEATAAASKYFGYAVSIVILLKFFTKGFVITKEVICFGAWLLWSLTGIMVAVSMYVFGTSFFRMFQFFVLFMLILRVADNFKNLKLISILFFLGFVEAVIYTFLSGDFLLGTETGERITGVSSNPNGLAIIIQHMLILQLAFFELSKKKWIKIFMLALLPFQAKLIFATGSKKGLIFFIFILLVWYAVFHWKDIVKRPLLFLFLLAGGLVFIAWMSSAIADTIVGKRMRMFLETAETGGGAGEQARIGLVKEGFRVFSEHPLIGVGLNQFGFNNKFGIYAHNTYIELLTNGGLIGFVLMMAVFVILALKGFKNRMSNIPEVAIVSKMVIVFFAYAALISLVAPLFFSHYHWVVLGLIAAFYETARRKGILRD